MIQSLEIHNFQSHKQSKLEFADGVNVIVGGSDTGKTSIIRALRWLIWNRPSGDAFRSTWGGSTSVDVIIDGQMIVRIKDLAGSEYALGETVFKAFGTDVPEEIVQALNLNEINLQSQMDSPFLISSTPGEVAQHFSRVAHLNQIDNGLRKVQQWIRAIEQDINSGERQAKQLEEDLQEFTHLDVFEEDVEVLEGMQSRLITKVNAEIKLNTLIVDLCNIDMQIVQESEILKDEKPVDELLDLFDKKKELKDDLQKLQKLIDDINNIKIELKFTGDRWGKYQREFIEKFPSICPLCGQKVKK